MKVIVSPEHLRGGCINSLSLSVTDMFCSGLDLDDMYILYIVWILSCKHCVIKEGGCFHVLINSHGLFEHRIESCLGSRRGNIDLC